MAAPCVEPQDMSSCLLNSSGIIKGHPKLGLNTPSASDLPLAINTKGSLIELAHKLKWAYKNFCPREDKSEEEDGFCVGDSWQNGIKPRPPLDPDRYVIQGLHTDGRPHPLLAYGDSLFRNAIPGHQYSYTSLGTVHDYNGSVYASTNGYLPFSSALAMNQMLQQRVESVEVDDEPKLDAGEGETATELAAGEVPESKDELIQRFLNENAEILSLKPTKNGVIGPSLWSLLTATKEIKDLDHHRLLQSFKLKRSEGILTEESSLCLQDVITNENGQVNLNKNNNDSLNRGRTMEGVAPCDRNGSTHLTNDSLEDLSDKCESCDNSTVHSNPESPELQSCTPMDVRDRLIVPLTDFEVSAICSSAVDFVVKHKTPARVLNQLMAVQWKQGKNISQFLPSRFDRTHAGDGLRKYKCPKCTYQTDNKSHLRRHVSSVHFIGMPYYCYICHKEFPRSEKVKAHFTKLHPDVEYDHRLVRKDNYFGVDYSPEAVNGGHDPGQKRPAPIKLTPTNMRTSCLSSGKNNTPHSGLSSNTQPTHSMLAQALGAPAVSEAKHSIPQNHKPIWKSPIKSEAGEKRYYCPQCPYTGKDIWHLKRHVNDVHQQLKDLKCPMCDYSTGRKHRLVSHMKNHGQLFCFHCDFSTDDLVIFQAHVKVCSLASRRAQHKCSRCERACTNRKQLQDHQYREHGIVMFCCSKCMFYSESDQEYKEHLQQHKEQHDGYVCQVCNEVLPDYRTLRSHLSSHKQSSTVTANNSNTPEKSNKSGEKRTQDKLKCPSCPFECYYYHVMKEHKMVHRENFLKCDISDCDFTTVWPLTLEHHKKSQHATAPASNPDKSNLELGPKGKGTFICPVCQDNRPPFRYKRSFDKHMAQHKEDEEKCPLCSQVFYFRASLKQHLKQDHQAHVIEVSSSDDESSDGSEESESDKDHQPQELSSQQQQKEAASSHSVPEVHVNSSQNQSSIQDHVTGNLSVTSDNLTQHTMDQDGQCDGYGPGPVLVGSMAPFV